MKLQKFSGYSPVWGMKQCGEEGDVRRHQFHKSIGKPSIMLEDLTAASVHLTFEALEIIIHHFILSV